VGSRKWTVVDRLDWLLRVVSLLSYSAHGIVVFVRCPVLLLRRPTTRPLRLQPKVYSRAVHHDGTPLSMLLFRTRHLVSRLSRGETEYLPAADQPGTSSNLP
jgi:hypothetical protein